MSAFLSTCNWVRSIKPELKKLDQIPLTGNAPPFPWEQLSANLAQIFACENLAISPGEIKWRSKDELLEGYGDEPFALTFAIPSLKGEACWVITKQQMAVLAALLLSKEPQPIDIHDKAFIESFCHFFALEVLFQLTQTDFEPGLVPALANHSILPERDSLCWDISLHLNNQTLWSRLIISPELRTSWIEHFAKEEYPPSVLTQHMAHLIDIKVHIEVGRTLLSMGEWSAVQAGDFITLDQCALHADSLTGRVLLTINGWQAFRANLKDGNLKILELPVFQEVETPMAKQPESEHEDEDDLSDLDLSEETNGEEEDEDYEDEDDYFEETGEDLFEDEEEELEAEEAENHIDEEAQETMEEPAETPSEALPEPEPVVIRGPLTPDQIPVALVVELGQIKMTMDQLLRLEPGNLLELDLHPENGVDLTINGKLVGKGELMRIGEALGIRVLELG